MQDRITRAFIESYAGKWIDDVKTDTHRAARKLAELGGLWSRSGKQEGFFNGIDDLLGNDRSEYYTIANRVTNTVAKNNLKRFGINFGCNALGSGAKKLREQAQAGHPVPWTAVITADERTLEGAGLQKLTDFTSDCREAGIYLFFLRVRAKDPGALRAYLAEFSDCAFALFLEGCEAPAALAADNALIALPLGGADEAFSALAKAGALRGVYADGAPDARKLEEASAGAAALDAQLLFLLSQDGPADGDAAAALSAYRAAPALPVFPVALPDDLLQLGARVAGRAMYLEVAPDGAAALRTAEGRSPLPNVYETPLSFVLRMIK
ncbi:MAG: hypothetical protein VB021_06055 [Oscillospiraceae bacterium]|nr:hypothetical protein [Oscillospiraceae bacterium]